MMGTSMLKTIILASNFVATFTGCWILHKTLPVLHRWTMFVLNWRVIRYKQHKIHKMNWSLDVAVVTNHIVIIVRASRDIQHFSDTQDYGHGWLKIIPLHETQPLRATNQNCRLRVERNALVENTNSPRTLSTSDHVCTKITLSY